MSKQKLKTKKSIAKRVKETATGKLKRHQAGKSHYATKKERKRKRNLRKATLVSPEDQGRIKKALPYGLP